MPDTQALEALLARVEGATGPSHDIDDAILRVLGFTWRGMDYCHHDGKTVMKGSPFLTSSLDAIVALIDREFDGTLPRHPVEMSLTSVGGCEGDEGPWRAALWIGAETDGNLSRAWTPALALCASFLRAKLAGVSNVQP